MQTIKKSEDGKVILTKRVNGLYAVSQEVPVWNRIARAYLNEWTLVQRDMGEAAALALFASLTKLAA